MEMQNLFSAQMLRSKFSSFSDFANYYRKWAGRLQGKGFLVNGCDDDGHGEDGVLTAANATATGCQEHYYEQVPNKTCAAFITP